MRGTYRAVGAVLVTFVFLSLPGIALADTYTVTTQSPSSFGCTADDCSLRGALEASNASTTVDDRIVIPAGGDPYRGSPLEITDSVEMVGAGADRTVLQGSESFSPVIEIAAESPAPVVLLEGLTITGGAGGIDNGGDLTLRRMSIDHNQRGGAAAIEGNGPLRLDSSFVGFNSPWGGIDVNAPVDLVNSTVTWNIGGAGIVGTTVNIANSAVLFNLSQSETGAGGASGVQLTARDSIFAGNKNAKGISNCSSPLSVRSLGGNVEDASTCAVAAGDRANANPRVDTLGLYGGTTQVYDLVPGSPAVDFATRCVSLDQRGMSRPQGAACDSGPYELAQAATAALPTGDRELFMKAGKKLRLRGNAIWVRLTCPASEASPPCRGKTVVADPPLVFHGPHTLQARPLKGKFKIQPGKTKWVPLREPRGTAKHLPNGPGKWKVYLLVFAEDGAGNDWKFAKKRMPLITARRG